MAVIRDNATYKPSEIKRASVSSNNPNLMANVGKQIEALNYGGGETDSLIIKVDNETNIITGDVKWQAFLGESDSTAYPGNKGADNHNKILELFDAISSEIRRAQSAESVIQNRLDSEITERIDTYRAILKKLYEVEEYVNSELRYEINTLNDRIDSTLTSIEANKNLINSINVDLRKSISDETKRAIVSETKIAEDIVEVKSDLELEISNTQTSLSNDISKLDVSIADLTDRVTTDIASAKSELKADYSIKIKDVTNDVYDLQEEIHSVESALTSKILDEESNRKLEDSRLSSVITTNIESLQSDLSELEFNLDKKISSNTAQIEEVRKGSTELSGNTKNELLKLNERLNSIDNRVLLEEQNRKSNDNRIESLIISNTTAINDELDIVQGELDKKYGTLMSDISNVRSQVGTLSTNTDSSIKSIEEDIDKLTTAITEETNSRLTKDAELSASLITIENTLTERVEIAEKSFEDSNAVTSSKFAAVDSRLSSIDRTLSISVTALDTLLNELSQKIDKEISDRSISDTNIRDVTNNDIRDTVEYVDSSVESVTALFKSDDIKLKLEMSNLLQSNISNVEKSINELNVSVEGIDSKFTEDIVDIRQQYDKAISQILIAKNESTDYTDEQILLVKKNTNELIYDTQQTLLSDIQSSSDKLQESIRNVNATIDSVSIRLTEEVSNRIKADADTLTSTKLLIDELHLYVRDKLKEITDNVDKSIKSAVEKLDAFDVLLLNDINKERLRAGNEEIRLDNLIRKESLDRANEDVLIRNEISISSGNSESRLLSVREELLKIISSETDRATIEEEKLYESIDTLRGDVTANFVGRVSDGVKEITRVYSDYNGETSMMIAGISPAADTLVKRDEEGRVILLNDRTEINKLNDASAAPKLYVDMMADNLRDNISDKLSSIVFIDGGKAPVPKT